MSFQEAFENGFTYGAGCTQNGWGCTFPSTFEIIDSAEPTFLLFTPRTTAQGFAATQAVIISPVFALEPGGIFADIIISDNGSEFFMETLNATTNFFNSRLYFQANGAITALQVATPPPCTTGVFSPTTGTWTPGVKMRVGLEVLNGGPNTLRVFKNGVQIFQGHDVSQFCNAGNPAIGISQIDILNSNDTTTTSLQMDNISSSSTINLCTTPLPFCQSDVFPPGGNATVDIDDLLLVIGTWGNNGNPSGPRPLGDCAPGATGDCLVNIDDILKVIGLWGPCPVPTGACCVQGSCSVTSQATCFAQAGFFSPIGTTCATVVCPTPPPGDLCANALTATNGVNNWNATNANVDGPTAPAACFPDGGGAGRDVWFKYTATCNGNVTFDTVGTVAPFTDTYLQVYNTHACPPGPMLGCNDDIDFGGNNFLSRVTVAMSNGQQVMVRCGRNAGSPADNNGPAVLNIGCTAFNNDLCSDASTLSVPGTITGSIVGTTDDEVAGATNCLPLIGNPPAQPPLGSGRWYKVTGNGNTLTASTCSTNTLEGETWDGRLAVYCGLNCPDLTCVVGSSTFDCGPSGTTQTGFHETVSWCSKAGQSYWILVAGDIVPKSPEGSYTLVVSSGAACANPIPCGLIPVNDACANAIPILNGTTSFNTMVATTDGTPNTPAPPGIDCNAGQGVLTSNDIWFRYTATCSGTLVATTCAQLGGNSNYDTDLVMYPGNATCVPASSAIIACNDDDANNTCGGGPLFQSTMFVPVTSGQTYLLRVGGWNNTTDRGTGVLNLTCTTAVCGNGIIEPGEQCDDNNNIPNDGCTNCTIDPNCAPACTINAVEACVVGTDTVNGGCNTTPTMFTPVTLTGGTAVVCGEAWAAPVGTSAGNRDLDWYTVTVGASGRVEAHITALSNLPMIVFVGNTTLGPSPNFVCSNTNVVLSAVATMGQCKVAVRSGLTPGSTAIVIAAPNTFTGFPCPGPWAYKVRIVSP